MCYYAEGIEQGIEDLEAQITRNNPPVFRELQGNRSESLNAQQQLKVGKANARTQARGQWAKWRATAIESKLSQRLAPIAEGLRADMQKLQTRRAILRDMSQRVSNDREALQAAMAMPVQSAAHAKAEVRRPFFQHLSEQASLTFFLLLLAEGARRGSSAVQAAHGSHWLAPLRHRQRRHRAAVA